MNIEIKTGDVTETWEFDEKYWLPKIVLTGYTKTELPIGKRKPVVIAEWSKNERERHYSRTWVNEPHISIEVRRMAFEKFTSMLEIVCWSGRT